MADTLFVYRDRRLLGFLVRDGSLSFRYTDQVVEEEVGEILVSASLRVRRRPFAERELLPYFEGLLPEGLARQRIATRFRLEYGDVFGLLREVGRDCAGALSILPEAAEPGAEAEDGVLWLTADELVEVVESLDVAPLGVRPDKRVRLSLAGVQDKLVVVVDPETGAIGLPQGTTPSTHILKPAPKERYPGLVVNEAYCLALAEEAGLSTVKAGLIQVGGSAALLVERYDRVRASGSVRRLHQEDFCQALAVPTDRKYQAEGGPDLRRMLDLLYRISSDAASDVERLVEWEAFNYLVGNADGHAKNVALLYADQYRLAPAYDLVSTEVFAELPDEMGQSIGGEYRTTLLTPRHWERELDRLGLNRRLFARRLASVGERVADTMPTARRRIEDLGCWSESLAAIEKLVHERREVLAGVAA